MIGSRSSEQTDVLRMYYRKRKKKVAVVRPAGFEPTTPGLGNDGSGAVSVGRQGVAAGPPETSAESTASPQRQGTARCDVSPADPVDEGLRRVIAAWSTLEGTLKDAVLALVSLTARGTGTEAK